MRNLLEEGEAIAEREDGGRWGWFNRRDHEGLPVLLAPAFPASVLASQWVDLLLVGHAAFAI